MSGRKDKMIDYLQMVARWVDWSVDTTITWYKSTPPLERYLIERRRRAARKD